ncbi:MAG: hypothetical protein JXA54_03805 [Candidatus Heimdallarchaeota archaeon]|nr:hypothetical protein [Candidatus Heimdallarchaeota archaeon]
MSAKERKQTDDWLTELCELIGQLIAEKDYRIRKKANKERYNNILRTIVGKGLIRTHALLANWLVELQNAGELRAKTIQEMTEQLPWTRDKTREHLDSLEEEGLLQFSRDSKGRKISLLNIEDDKQKVRQLANLLWFFKAYPKQSEQILPSFYPEYSAYYKSIDKWLLVEKSLVERTRRYEQASEEEMNTFVEQIGSLAFIENTREFERKLLETIKWQPLLLYSLKKR